MVDQDVINVVVHVNKDNVAHVNKDNNVVHVNNNVIHVLLSLVEWACIVALVVVLVVVMVYGRLNQTRKINCYQLMSSLLTCLCYNTCLY